MKENILSTDTAPKRTFHRRHGKIGRLPPELRDHVNQSLLEGCTYPTIIARLAERGHPGIKPPNLVAWAKGGYQDWLLEREQATQYRARCEAIIHLYTNLPPETRAQMGDINNFAVALQFNETLQHQFTPNIADAINKRPENFFRLAGFITTNSSEQTRRKRLELESKKFQFKMAKMGLKTDELAPALTKLTGEETKPN